MQPATPLDRQLGLSLLRTMLLIRRFEEQCAEEYSKGNIRGFLHLYIGEEAVAAGIISALAENDPIFATYREHGHALTRGIDPKKIMAEMFGVSEGICRGRGGSMHLFDRQKLFFGGNAIVGGALPIAVGYGLGCKLRGIRNVVCCFFGEGAMAEGIFHESMNLAALWRIPILFVCENNLYAMGTALERSEAQTDLSLKAAAYGVKAMSVDGMDVVAVRQAAERALTEIRELDEPYFVECKTYRFRAHSMFDPELYRSSVEVDLWKRQDPLPKLIAQLQKDNLLNDAELTSMHADSERQVQEALAFAAQGTPEPVKEMMRFVYSESEVPQANL